jgi:hypothetical protein
MKNVFPWILASTVALLASGCGCNFAVTPYATVHLVDEQGQRITTPSDAQPTFLVDGKTPVERSCLTVDQLADKADTADPNLPCAAWSIQMPDIGTFQVKVTLAGFAPATAPVTIGVDEDLREQCDYDYAKHTDATIGLVRQ